MNAPPASSLWEAATSELKQLLDDLAADHERRAREAAERAKKTAVVPKPQPAKEVSAEKTGAVEPRPAEPATPPVATPAPKPQPADEKVPAQSATAAVAPAPKSMFNMKHVSALLAALAGTGVSGSSILEAVRTRIDRAPREHLLLAAAIVAGLLAAFFAFKFILKHVHRTHEGAVPDEDFFAPWREILTLRRVLSLIVAVVGALAAGAGGMMIYNGSDQPNEAKPATETSPAATPAGKTPIYGITGSGLLATIAGLLVLYRKPAPANATAGNAKPAEISQSQAPPQEAVQSVPTPAHLQTSPVANSPPEPDFHGDADEESEASQSVAAGDEPVARPFQPGDPAAILLGFDTPLTRVRNLFGLDSFACNVLLLTVACESDDEVAKGCARLQGGSPFPIGKLAVALFADPALSAFAPDAGSERAAKVAALAADAPLRAWRLIETFQPDGRNLLGATLKADEPILHFLIGQPRRDERLQRFRAPLAPDAAAGRAALSQWKLARGLAPRLRAGELCELRGSDPVSKQLVALAAHGWRVGAEESADAAAEAHALGMETLERVACSSLPKEQDDIALVAKLWQRQGRLLGGAFYVDAEDAETPEQFAALRLFLRCLAVQPAAGANSAAEAQRVFVATVEALPDLGVPQFTVAVAKPGRPEQEKQWEELVNDADVASQLADEFDFNLPTIRRLHGVSAGGLAGVRATCRQSHRSRLDALAQRVIPVADWDALVLPDFQKNLLRALADQVRCRGRVYRRFGFADTMNRGFGISALFSGESGTGKTTAAEVIAADLGVDLYRVDLSAVVDKYIGETEKKLRRLFDSAEEGGVALCFDECDAIFGRRSEVKDAHDRYANIQVSYLLQRLESFTGLAMLTTNQADAIDHAFLRRLRFIVNFPMPDRALRREIWQRVFPPQFLKEVPCDPPFDNDLLDTLAETPLSGGQIHAVALNAAFLAARETPPHLTLKMIEHATDAEFLKTGNPIRHTTFPAPPEPPAEATATEPPPTPTQAAA